MRRVRDAVWRQRALFTFDHQVPQLLDFFAEVIRSATAGTSARPRKA